jgi:RimJ/RimL family protein N-acetyltransferase
LERHACGSTRDGRPGRHLALSDSPAFASRSIASMDIYLETERLVLRRFTPDDVDLVTALDADPAVMRYINGGRPTPRDEVRDDYLPFWLAYYERGDRYGFWAAIERATGEFLGWFHLRPRREDSDDEPELGYRLVASTWGRGFATEGSRALVRKAFEELGARRVYATTMVVNEASWRVMEKAGLRRIRVFHEPWPDRIEGEEHGDVEYAITRDEWGAIQAAGRE